MRGWIRDELWRQQAQKADKAKELRKRRWIESNSGAQFVKKRLVLGVDDLRRRFPNIPDPRPDQELTEPSMRLEEVQAVFWKQHKQHQCSQKNPNLKAHSDPFSLPNRQQRISQIELEIHGQEPGVEQSIGTGALTGEDVEVELSSHGQDERQTPAEAEEVFRGENGLRSGEQN